MEKVMSHKMNWLGMACAALMICTGCKSEETKNTDAGITGSDASKDSSGTGTSDSAGLTYNDTLLLPDSGSGVSSDAKTADAAPAVMVKVDGTVEDDQGNPIADATISVVGASVANSVKTASDGSYEIQVKAGAKVFLKAEKSGYVSMIHGLEVPQSGAQDFPLWLLKPSLVTDWVNGSTLGTWDSTNKGLVYMEFEPKSGLGGEGAKLSLANAGALTENNNEEMVISEKLLSNGLEYLIFLNVTPGSAKVTNITSPSGWTCKLDDPSLTDYVVQANAITQIDLSCTKN